MEALSILKFWRNTIPGADVSCDGDDMCHSVIATDDEVSDDDEDSLFDLVLKSPDCCDIKRGNVSSTKKFQCIESPRDVFLSKNDLSNSKPSSPITILRSTPKFKVFMLGFKKSSKIDNAELKASPLSQQSTIGQSNRFGVKCRAEEMPAASTVIGRENSLKSKMLKESADDVVSLEKSVPKYLKLMKPFYLKISKKEKVTGSLTPSSSPLTVPVNLSLRKFPSGNRVGSFKIAASNLGKSRSASAVVGVAPPLVRRRDDSLLDDGIQGAILHCKKSYSVTSQDFSPLLRSASDPSYGTISPPVRNSYEEPKRYSV